MVRKKLVQIKFIKDFENWNSKGDALILKYKKGDIIEAIEENAENFVIQGYAEYVEDFRLKEAKYYRDKFTMETEGTPNLLLPRNKGIALNIAGIDPKNYEMILKEKGIEEPKKEINEYGKEIGKVINNYFDKSDLAEKIWSNQPYFYDKSRLWWLWNLKEYKWEKVDDKDILIMVSDNSNANTVNSKEKSEILEAMEQYGRRKIPKNINPMWVQFKDLIVDIETGNEFKASPEYFVTNPIPWKLHKERFVKTPKMDNIFEEWVGKEYVEILYQIIAYSLIPSYPIHRIFCFIGEGMNGKSKYLDLLRKFIGEPNCCATELDTLINSRFEVTRLHKKLVCQMGETNFNEMSKTSILKKLSGGDLIGFEYKRKDPFEEKNYAKILIATNNLPTTTDKTIGFYRRWMIIDFPNSFSEKKDILADIPEEEYQILAVKCLGILSDLLKERKFHKEGSIEDRAKKYEDHSDPLEKFIKEFTLEDSESHIFKFEFEKRLTAWCKENKFRILSEIAIGKKMKEKNIEVVQRYPDWMSSENKKLLRAWSGIRWKIEDSQDSQDSHPIVT